MDGKTTYGEINGNVKGREDWLVDIHESKGLSEVNSRLLRVKLS